MADWYQGQLDAGAFLADLPCVRAVTVWPLITTPPPPSILHAGMFVSLVCEAVSAFLSRFRGIHNEMSLIRNGRYASLAALQPKDNAFQALAEASENGYTLAGEQKRSHQWGTSVMREGSLNNRGASLSCVGASVTGHQKIVCRVVQ